MRNRGTGRWLVALVAVGLIGLATPLQGQETGRISGTVTDSTTGAPITGQTVTAEGPISGSSTTATDGSYTIDGLAPGKYVVGTGNWVGPNYSDYVATWWPRSGNRGSAQTVDVQGGQVTEHIDLATRIGGVVTGKVTNAWNGYPIYPGWVTARPANAWPGANYPLDSKGNFRISGLSGSYQLTVNQERYLNFDSDPFIIGPGENLTIDITLTPEAGSPYATITGVACEVGSTATECWAPDPEDGSTMSPLAGLTLEARTPQGKLLGTTTTDAWGWFVLEELTPGKIVVSMPRPPPGMEAVGAQSFDLAYDEYADTELMARRVGVHLMLESTLTPREPTVDEEFEFRLSTIFASTTKPIDPFEVTGVSVSVFLPEGLDYLTHRGDGPYDPGTGVWRIPKLPYLGRTEMTIVLQADHSGSFRPHAEVASSDWPDPRAVFGDGRGDDFTSQSVDVTPIQMTVEEAVIGGNVWRDSDEDGFRDADEPPLTGVTVIAANEDGKTWSTGTGADGNYRVADLAAGTYQVTLDEATLPDNVLAPAEPVTVVVGPDTVLTDVDFPCISVAATGWWIAGVGFGVVVGGLVITWLLLRRRHSQVSAPTEPTRRTAGV